MTQPALGDSGLENPNTGSAELGVRHCWAIQANGFYRDLNLGEMNDEGLELRMWSEVTLHAKHILLLPDWRRFSSCPQGGRLCLKVEDCFPCPGNGKGMGLPEALGKSFSQRGKDLCNFGCDSCSFPAQCSGWAGAAKECALLNRVGHCVVSAGQQLVLVTEHLCANLP